MGLGEFVAGRGKGAEREGVGEGDGRGRERGPILVEDGGAEDRIGL